MDQVTEDTLEQVYQLEGKVNIGCDPPEMPTAEYIKKHINAYTNANLTCKFAQSRLLERAMGWSVTYIFFLSSLERCGLHFSKELDEWLLN